jgi:hypothetical protein
MRSRSRCTRSNHLAVLAEHQLDDAVGSKLVDAERGRVDGFGRERLPLRTDGHEGIPLNGH